MSNFTYILVGIVFTFIIRVLPLTLIRKPIENEFIKSFLYYVPYVTLSLMTFPAIIDGNAIPGMCAFVVGVICAYRGFSLLSVASICCIVFFGVNLV